MLSDRLRALHPFLRLNARKPSTHADLHAWLSAKPLAAALALFQKSFNDRAADRKGGPAP